MDRVTWGDRWFDMAESEQNRCTYLLETAAGVIAYLTVHYDGNSCLIADEVAVDVRKTKQGYGGVLLRFADTLARHHGCQKVRINAIKEQIDWYTRSGYALVPGRDPLPLDGEEYFPMERVVLYHLPRTNV
jgi:N-acetylglutamate synthase-like GNAT family acetyltransferase